VLFARQAVQDVEIGGWPIPKGGIVRVVRVRQETTSRFGPGDLDGWSEDG